MKRFLFYILLFPFSFKVGAQTNFYKLSAGAGFGGTTITSDLNKKKIGYAANGVVDYYFTPYMNLGFEMQAGTLKGGEISSKSFENNFKTIAFNGRLQMGQFLSESALNSFVLNNLRGFYIGSGLGVIQNNVVISAPTNKNYKYKAKEIFVPLNVGINFNLQSKWQDYARYMLNVNYQTGFSFEDGMDGTVVLGTKNDVFTFFSIGLRYNFGNIGLDQSKRRL